MKKLGLSLEDLVVESFDVIAETKAVAGTVHARAAGTAATEPSREPDSICTCPAIPGGCTCDGQRYTCGQSCPEGTCWVVGCTLDETDCSACVTACPTACTCGESICWPCAVTTACVADGA